MIYKKELNWVKKELRKIIIYFSCLPLPVLKIIEKILDKLACCSYTALFLIEKKKKLKNQEK